MSTQGNTPSIGDMISRLLEEQKNNNFNVRTIERPSVIEIMPEAPWASAPDPISIRTNTSLTKVVPDYERNTLRIMKPDNTPGSIIGIDGLRQLGIMTGYKVDFVNKLPLNMRAEVINEVIRQHREQDIQFIGEDETITQTVPQYREVCKHSEVAQIAFNTMQGICTKTGSSASVKNYSSTAGSMKLHVVSSIQEKITAHRGDILNFGVVIEHKYGSHLGVSLGIERLICENGMTVVNKGYSWSSKAGEVSDQLDYVVIGINECITQFAVTASRARTMAETMIQGDPREALIARARNMRLDSAYFPDLVNAWEQEPGNSEWHMVNAFTRLATHNKSVEDKTRRNIQAASGAWTHEFNVVNARLPRQIAERVGAQIIEN